MACSSWDGQIQSLDGATIFHTAAWAQVLAESYGYRPIYFIALNDSKIIGCLPVMDIKSPLTGCRGVSLPFTDECYPLCKSSNLFNSIWRHATAFGKKAGWKFIELRGEHQAYETEPECKSYYTHTIDLDGNDGHLLSNFRDSTKRNIIKAIKSDVEIRKSYSLESIKSFYKLNCLIRKNHGLPPQPFKFFHKVYEYIIKARMGFVLLAIYKGVIVAAAVFFLFQNKILYKYAASNNDYQRLRSNNLLIWEAMKYASKSGFKQFQFGRTEIGNSGLLQFKRGWGATESIQKYFRYTIAGSQFCECSPKLKSSYSFFEIMPMPFLKFIGKMFYRHVG
jgi:hypothetical protein